MGTWELIDHTADVGLDITASCQEYLLATAARATFAIVLEDRPEEVVTRKEVRVRTPADLADEDELLVSWLQELLWQFHRDRLVPLEFDFHEKGPSALRARVGFGRFDPDRHRTGTEIKAVTYHGLTVEQTDRGWHARVIFDI